MNKQEILNRLELDWHFSEVISEPNEELMLGRAERAIGEISKELFSEVIPEVLKSCIPENMVLESVGNSAEAHTQTIKVFKQKALELYNITL